MDWLREILKNAGIPEDKLDSAIAEVNKTLPKYFIPKDKYNEVAEAKKKLEADIQERDNQLEQLKNAAGNSEELKAQIEQLQAENQKAAEEWQAKMAQMQLDFAIEKALAAAKAKNAKAVKALLDMEKVKLDGEQLLGLDDQLKTLKETDPYLFGEPGRVGGGTNPPGGAEPKTIDQQIEEAIKAGNTALAIRLKNEKYFFKKE
jgi:cysteinyl-tRNA synthetase